MGDVEEFSFDRQYKVDGLEHTKNLALNDWIWIESCFDFGHKDAKKQMFT